jgi:hypothetical protein
LSAANYFNPSLIYVVSKAIAYSSESLKGLFSKGRLLAIFTYIGLVKMVANKEGKLVHLSLQAT